MRHRHCLEIGYLGRCPFLLSQVFGACCSFSVLTSMSSRRAESTRSQVLSILVDADPQLVGQLLRLDLPETPIRDLRESCVQGCRGVNRILTQVQYRERIEKRPRTSIWGFFTTCQACARPVITLTETTFSCGHLICNSCIGKVSRQLEEGKADQ